MMASDRYHAWRNLAVARPELAEMIQEKLLAAWQANRKKTDFRGPHLGDLESFLLSTKGTNPELVLSCFIDAEDTRRLVNMAIIRPDRVPIRTVIVLLLLTGKNGVISSLEHLCTVRPEALVETQKVLLSGDVGRNTFTSVCSAIHGMDLDQLDEHVLANWTRFEQQRFHETVKREIGPLHDFLIVARIMEM